MSNSFVILRFPVNGDDRESGSATIYIDGFTGALYLDKPAEVDRYAQAFTGIWSVCLNETAPVTSSIKPQRNSRIEQH